MKKTETNLILITVLFASALVTSNVLAGKAIVTGWTMFGQPVQFTSAVLAYAITFLATDVVGELWGRAKAQTVVLVGFAAQVLSTVLIMVALAMPAAADTANVYHQTLGTNWLFFIASMTAYLVSQTWDVRVFHRIRDAILTRNSDNWRHRWIWNNASTVTSQLIDSLIFNGIAFGIGFGMFSNPAALAAMIIPYYGIKILIAILDTPLFYLLTRNSKQTPAA